MLLDCWCKALSTERELGALPAIEGVAMAISTGVLCEIEDGVMDIAALRGTTPRQILLCIVGHGATCRTRPSMGLSKDSRVKYDLLGAILLADLKSSIGDTATSAKLHSLLSYSFFLVDVDAKSFLLGSLWGDCRKGSLGFPPKGVLINGSWAIEKSGVDPLRLIFGLKTESCAFGEKKPLTKFPTPLLFKGERSNVISGDGTASIFEVATSGC